MGRAAVLIGVDGTGDLPTLSDAAAGARRMEAWAREQAMSDVVVITDENDGRVEIGDVKRAIREIVEQGTTEQLVVYFAGHGVNLRNGEIWLLSDAPGDTQAAINVVGSEVLARYSGIRHVVFISDACRTAAEGIRAQFVTGSEIFPNEGAGDLEQPVDQFFACTLGRPAHEIRDPQTTSSEYSAIYTQALLDALQGTRSDPPEWAPVLADSCRYLRPRKLKAHLQADVAQRLKDRDLHTKLIQVPDARITSDEEAWLSRRALDAAAGDGGEGAEPPPTGSRHRRSRRRGRTVADRNPPPPPPMTTARLLTTLLRPALAGDTASLHGALAQARTVAPVPGATAIADGVELASTPFGPLHHESGCGFKLRGARFATAYSHRATAEPMGDQVVRMHGVPRPGTTVLLTFEGGEGVALPAIAGFLTALTVQDGELVDVAYEPSDNGGRWSDFESLAGEIRALRAVAAAAARDGVFELGEGDAAAVADRMRYAVSSVDPALAVYAAYAFHALHDRARIRQMSALMRADLGCPLFDVALLAGDLRGARTGAGADVLSSLPLLSQGWALLSAYRVALPETLRGMEDHLKPSVWTMLEPAGVVRMRVAMARGEVS